MPLIIKKVRLIKPPFMGTRIHIRVPADSLVWGPRSVGLAEGDGRCLMDWGDGTQSVLTKENPTPTPHIYAQSGDYEVQLGPEAVNVSCSSAESGVHREVYAPMIQFVSAGEGLAVLDESAFANATALYNIKLPGVVRFAAESESVLPFAGCPLLREIHFASANEAAIKATPAYSCFPHLGAPEARQFFDL